MSKRIKIAISSCLLGNNVRYNGGNKLDRQLLDSFGAVVDFVPLCPEVEAGLGVPRDAMRLVRLAGSTRLVTIATGIDLTDRVTAEIEKKLAELEGQGISGFILKARSPSCGIGDAEMFAEEDHCAKGTGLFAAAVLRRFPELPAADEEALRDVKAQECFFAKACGHTCF